MKCPRCGERIHAVEGDRGREYADEVCADCAEQLEREADVCIADDSTECDCSRCRAAEDAFWDEQTGGDA